MIRYAVLAMLALLPTAFSVAYEFDKPGTESVSSWLSVAWPLLLLLSAQVTARVWRHRAGRLLGVVLSIPMGVAAGVMFWRHMAGLLAFLGVAPGPRVLVPTAVVASYTVIGIISGRIRGRR